MPGRRFSSPEDPIGRRRTTVSSRSTSDHEESLIDLEIQHLPAKLLPLERKQAVPDPQPRKRPETNEFSTMSGFRLEPFSGHRSEDVKTFIRICAHDFRRMASLYDDNDGEKEQARLDYLYSYTTGEARKWMSTLPRKVRSLWD